MDYLRRSPRERLHTTQDDSVTKYLLVGSEEVLFKVSASKAGLIVEFAMNVSAEARAAVSQYIQEWFDLDTNLRPFYQMARTDELLHPLIKKFKGHRIIGQPDLFESLVWAVLGQQINLSFAYTLKERFVEKWGTTLTHAGKTYYLFPSPAVVAGLNQNELLALQFSRQKADYTVGIAKAFVEGRLTKDMFKGLTLAEGKEKLMQIRGVGNWTANYALMRTFRYPDAFPLEDAGLHNAIKNQLGLRKKPSVERVRRIFKKYKGWEAYATLYLWKSL